MAVLRSIWLPVLVALLTFAALGFLSALAFMDELAGVPVGPAAHLLLSPLGSSTIFIGVISGAAFSAGCRTAKHSESNRNGGLAGAIIPLVLIASFSLMGMIESGSTELDELGNEGAMIKLSMTLAIAALSGVAGAFFCRHRVPAA